MIGALLKPIAEALGFSVAKLVIVGLLAIGLVTIITLGYFHYTGLVEDNARLRENEVKLTAAIETEKGATKAAVDANKEWKAAAARQEVELKRLTDVSVHVAGELRRLNDVFAKHDVGALLQAKPNLVLDRINNGTARALSLFECQTAGGQQCAYKGGQADGVGPARPRAR